MVDYYRAMVKHMKIAPSEYWAMSPVEMMVLLDEEEPEKQFSDEQLASLERHRAQLEAEGHLVL